MQNDDTAVPRTTTHRLAQLAAHVHHLEQQARHAACRATRAWLGAVRQRPALLSGLTLGLGIAIGGVALSVSARQEQRLLQQAQASQAAQAQAAQRELNAMASRVAELQAQASRLNALGARLARDAGMPAAEFDFGKPVGVGGGGPVRDVTPGELRGGIGQLQGAFEQTGQQLTVLESLLMDRQLRAAALPSHAPMTQSYITSRFGVRSDPFGGGSQFHKGIDFAANVGDPVLAAAGGVVSYAADRSGYGLTIEVDHGNGYVTRYAHNSQLLVRPGDLVRAGTEVAKAGSTGRSTGAHVHLEVWKDGVVVDPLPFLRDGTLEQQLR